MQQNKFSKLKEGFRREAGARQCRQLFDVFVRVKEHQESNLALRFEDCQYPLALPIPPEGPQRRPFILQRTAIYEEMVSVLKPRLSILQEVVVFTKRLYSKVKTISIHLNIYPTTLQIILF
jgi:hypothetical protein